MTGPASRKDLVFIASGGRTGTNFLGQRLSRVIDDCWSEHEPDVFDWRWKTTRERIRRFGVWHMVFGRLAGVAGLRPLGHRLLTGSLDEDACVRLVRRQRAAYHASIREPLVIESSLRFWMFASRIHLIWPEAKLIGIIRDPREWVESWRRHQPRRHTALWFGWFPLGALTPRAVGDTEWVDRWGELDQFGRLAWDWRIINRELDRAVSRAPNIRLFRFEDIFDPEKSAMRELVDFAADHGARKYRIHDLEGFTATLRNESKGPRRNWQDWPIEDVMLLEELCGPLMRKYGYGAEPEWRARLETAG